MRILVANKFWYRRGGLERVMFDEVALLERAGHDVAHFSTSHPDNIESPWSEYFVPYLELGEGAGLSASDKLRAATRMFGNGPAKERFERLVDAFEPDLVHVHGIHRQISPSPLAVTRRRGIPVVQSIHDGHHVCPADVLLRGGTTECLPRSCGSLWYGPAVRYRCVRGSTLTSALAATETTVRRARRVFERSVSRFICTSERMRGVLEEGGFDPGVLRVLHPSIPLDEPADSRGYALYAGRLSREKGVSHFLEATRNVGIPAVVAGSGPLDKQLRRDFPEAEFVGYVDGERVAELVRHALVAVLPSLCGENAPLAVLEPMAAGVPVISSAVGGVPEIVEHEETGLLVPPGDTAALEGALSRVLDDPAFRGRLGAAGRERAALRHSPERYVGMLVSIYEEALAS